MKFKKNCNISIVSVFFGSYKRCFTNIGISEGLVRKDHDSLYVIYRRRDVAPITVHLYDFPRTICEWHTCYVIESCIDWMKVWDLSTPLHMYHKSVVLHCCSLQSWFEGDLAICAIPLLNILYQVQLMLSIPVFIIVL